MKKLLLFPMTLLGMVLLAQFISCEREPVYIGDLLTDPTDTIPEDTTGQIVHPCDPDSVYFEKDVLPILVSNCTMSGCHDVASHKEGVILTDYHYTRNTGGIKLSNPANSALYKVLNETGGDQMPPPPAAQSPVRAPPATKKTPRRLPTKSSTKSRSVSQGRSMGPV